MTRSISEKNDCTCFISEPPRDTTNFWSLLNDKLQTPRKPRSYIRDLRVLLHSYQDYKVTLQNNNFKIHFRRQRIFFMISWKSWKTRKKTNQFFQREQQCVKGQEKLAELLLKQSSIIGDKLADNFLSVRKVIYPKYPKH